MEAKQSYKKLEPRVKELEKKFDKRERIRGCLKEREKTLQALLNAPIESAILADLEGTILASNEIAAKRLGMNLDEFIGLGLFEYLPHDVATSREARAVEVVRSGKPLRFNDERAGRFYDNNIYPVFDDEGKVSALAIYARDITEQVQAEKELRKSHDELELRVRERTSELHKVNEQLKKKIVELNKAKEVNENLIKKLQNALAEIKVSRGILPFCSFCKKIRDDEGYWQLVDVYISKHSQADISHSICPECAKAHYPDLFYHD